MYCSHCGKKVGDAMLFCPFCGEPIVIPEQDEEPAAAQPKEAVPSGEAVPEAPVVPEDKPIEKPSRDEDSGSGDADDAAAELLDWNLERLGRSDEWARRDEAEETFSPLQLDETEIKVLQNRGLRNCAETSEVAAFKEEWLRWILAGCPRKADGTPVGAKEIMDTKPEAPAENKETKEAA